MITVHFIKTMNVLHLLNNNMVSILIKALISILYNPYIFIYKGQSTIHYPLHK